MDIFREVGRGNLEYIINILSSHPRIDICKLKDLNFRTLLHWAVKNNRIEIVNFLLTYNCDINAQDNKGLTALHYAANKDINFENNSLEQMVLLIERGANINLRDISGNTPLHIACRGGNIDLIQTLISHGADRNIPNMNNLVPVDIAQQQVDAAINDPRYYNHYHAIVMMLNNPTSEWQRFIIQPPQKINTKELIVETHEEKYMFENGKKVMNVQREHENAITIFIFGHGSEDITEFFEGNVELLSFNGYPSALGRLFHNEFSVFSTELIKQYQTTRERESQSNIFNRMPQILRTVYKKNGFAIDKFFRNKGFKITKPNFSRKFFLHKSNIHEDDSEYGIYVIDASNPLDDDYTIYRNIDNSRINNSYEHWSERINDYWREKEDRLKQKKIALRRRLVELINMNANIEEIITIQREIFSISNENKYNTKQKTYTKSILDNIINDKQVTLKNLVNFFRNIGYLKVYIYDPTCRADMRSMTSIDPSKNPDSRERDEDDTYIYLQEGKQQSHIKRAMASILERINSKKHNKFANVVKAVMPAKTRKTINRRRMHFLNNGIEYHFETDKLIYVFTPTFINGELNNIYKVFIGEILKIEPNFIDIKLYHVNQLWAGIIRIDTSIPIDTTNYTLDTEHDTIANICQAYNIEDAVEIFRTRFPQIAQQIIPSLDVELGPPQIHYTLEDIDGGSYKNRKIKHRKTKHRKTKHTKTKHKKS